MRDSGYRNKANLRLFGPHCLGAPLPISRVPQLNPPTIPFLVSLIISILFLLQAAGKYRQEGKNYVVHDGDIIFFKFNAGAGLTDKKKVK